MFFAQNGQKFFTQMYKEKGNIASIINCPSLRILVLEFLFTVYKASL